MPTFTAVSKPVHAPFVLSGEAKHAMVALITFTASSDLPLEEIPCLRWIHIDLFPRKHRTELHWSLATHGQTKDAFAICDFSFRLEAGGKSIKSSDEMNQIPLRILRSGMYWHYGKLDILDIDHEIFHKVDELTIPSLTLNVPFKDLKLRRLNRKPPVNITEAEEALRDADTSVYPEDPSRVAVKMENLATFLEEAGRNSESEAMYLRAIEIWERISPGNEMAFKTLDKLGALLKKTGCFQKPELLYSRVVAISEVYQLRKQVYLEPRSYPNFSYNAGLFAFEMDEMLLKHMVDIAKTMVSLFDITPEEAIGRMNRHWQGQTFALGASDDLVFRETPDYWAKLIYFVDGLHWWTYAMPPLKAKPYP